MRKWMLITAVAIGIAMVSLGCQSQQAADPASPETANEEVLGAAAGDTNGNFDGHRMIADLLGLTDEQIAAMKEIGQKYREQFRALRQQLGPNPDREAAREQFKALRRQMLAEMRQVLTPEQQTRLDAWKAQLENGQIPEEFVDYRVNRLHQLVGLSEEQKQQVKELFQQAGTFRGLPFFGPPPEMRQQNRSRRREVMQKLREILTEDQLTKLREAMKERARNGRRGGPHMARALFTRLAQALQLTDEQKQQLRQILEEFRQNHQPPEGGPGFRGRFHRPGQGQNPPPELQELWERIASILTDEQKAKLQEIRQNFQQRFGGRK